MIDQLIKKTIHGLGDSDKHLLSLFSIALGSQSKTIIELGVRNGDTTLPLLLAAKYNEGHVYSVDINESIHEIPEDLKKYSSFIKKDAIEFLNSWDQNNKIDFLYIDDWHSYEHVKKELEILDKLVSPSTIILLHDLMYGETCPFYHVDLTKNSGEQWNNGGPYRAVAELNPQFWEFSTLPYNNGLTLLRKKYSNKYRRK